MARVNAQQYADKLIRRAQSATEDMRRSIQDVTVSPTEKAAARQDKMLAGVQKAVTSGKWSAGLRAVSLDDWKRATIEKGLARYPQGLEASRPKIEAVAGALLAHVDAGRQKIANMPDLTLDQQIARSAEFIRHMSTFKKGRS